MRKRDGGRTRLVKGDIAIANVCPIRIRSKGDAVFENRSRSVTDPVSRWNVRRPTEAEATVAVQKQTVVDIEYADVNVDGIPDTEASLGGKQNVCIITDSWIPLQCCDTVDGRGQLNGWRRVKPIEGQKPHENKEANEAYEQTDSNPLPLLELHLDSFTLKYSPNMALAVSGWFQAFEPCVRLRGPQQVAHDYPEREPCPATQRGKGWPVD